MKLSTALRRTCNLCKVEPQDKIFADLLAIGYNEADAFNISHPEYEAVSDTTILKMAKEKQYDKKFSAYYEKMKARYKRANYMARKEDLADKDLSDSEVDKLLAKYTDKNSLIKMLAIQAESCKDPKIRANILLKIAELQNMKKEEVKEEHKYLTFYMPLTCNNCNIKQLAEARKTKVKELEEETSNLKVKLKNLENTGEIIE